MTLSLQPGSSPARLRFFISGKQPREEITPLYSVSSPDFRSSAGALLGPDFIAGNSITTLVNGTQIFPAMLSAIRAAKHSVNFESYWFTDGQVGREFTEALAERALAGVKVSAIFDAMGTLDMGDENLARLRATDGGWGGDAIALSIRIFWLDPRRYNHRTHRKLLIIDGKIAFVGGAGIADDWNGNADSPQHWRDNHYQFTGPVVAQLQGIFMANWLKTGGHGFAAQGLIIFPLLASLGKSLAQALRSSAGNANLDFDVSPRDCFSAENVAH